MEEILMYELSLYLDIKTILENKVYIVEHEVTKQLYIKKILSSESIAVYEKLKGTTNKNRARIEDYFLVGDFLIVIEELVNGRTIENILETEEISEKEANRIVMGICSGLADLHSLENPIIHRDIKPSNVIISSDGIVKLIDFDAARVSNELNNKDTKLIGTEGYASPEQFGFAQTDIRSDIYSIGVLLNYMLTKKFPREELVSGNLGSIVQKATQIDRNYRYQNVLDMQKALIFVNIGSKNNEKPSVKEKKIKPKKKEKIKIRIPKVKQSKKSDVSKDKLLNVFSRVNNMLTLKVGKKWRASIGRIVGYRRANILLMILSTCWYFFAVVGLCMTIAGFSRENLFLTLYLFVLPTFMFGGGFGINKYLPLVKGKRVMTRVLGKTLLWVILTLLAGFLMGS